jgi:hypothetical protein
MDYLVLRKDSAEAVAAPGATLAGLWPRLSLATVVELKTVGRPYRTNGLDRLWSYVLLYRADEENRALRRSEIRAALIVPNRTPALLADVDAMGLRWEDLGRGYWQLHGGPFALYVVELVVVAEEEGDDVLRAFVDEPQRTPEGRRFWAELAGTQEVNMAMHEMEGYDEVIRRLLSGLTPEQRLEGLTPEQRLAGLTTEQVVLSLPDPVLRSLSDEFLTTLSEPTRAAIRSRLGH